MAKKSSKKEEAPQEEGPQTYTVTAKQNLGPTITGSGIIAAGKKGEVTMEPARYERLKKAGHFEDAE